LIQSRPLLLLVRSNQSRRWLQLRRWLRSRQSVRLRQAYPWHPLRRSVRWLQSHPSIQLFNLSCLGKNCANNRRGRTSVSGSNHGDRKVQPAGALVTSRTGCVRRLMTSASSAPSITNADTKPAAINPMISGARRRTRPPSCRRARCRGAERSSRPPIVQRCASCRFRTSFGPNVLPGFPEESVSQVSGTNPEMAGWGARIRTWEWRNQNPLPYHLATPHCVRGPYWRSRRGANGSRSCPTASGKRAV
jgi:hypothetical protein